MPKDSITRAAPRGWSGDAPRVAFLAGTLGRGGAERQLVYMLRALRTISVEPRVLCLTQGEALESQIMDLGIPVEHVGERGSPAWRVGAITRSLRRKPVDLLQSAHFYTNSYAGIATRAVGAKSIGALRNDVSTEIRANRPFGWGHLLSPHVLIANSRPAVERALQLGRSESRVFLIANAVDTDSFSPAGRDTLSSGNNHPASVRLLLVGRLVPQKRIDIFLRLVGEVVSELPATRVEARIAGEGPLRPSLERQSEELGLMQTVEFLGEVRDTRPHYHWADLLVLTSGHEGTPNVVLEAMASGLPVVAFGVGGVPDLLRNGGGSMVPPGDETALERATLDIVRSPGLSARLGAEGRREALTRSLDMLGKRLLRVYHAALAP